MGLSSRCAAFLVLTLAACVNIETSGTPNVVIAVWDPTNAVLPKPTDLVRDADAGMLALPIDASQTAAEQEFRAYLNTLDGYPTSTPLKIPLSDHIDPDSVAGNLIMLDAANGQEIPLTHEYDSAQNILKAYATGAIPIAAGHTYIYALRGYELGATGSDDRMLVADAAFSFLRADEPLTDHIYALPGETRLDKSEAAETLEEARLGFAPLFELLEAVGLPREEVAVAGSFTTSAEPAIFFDPLTRVIPFPNNLLKNPLSGQIDLPIATDEDEDARHLKEGLSKLDGFSTTAAIAVEATHALSRNAALDPAALRLFRVDDGSYDEVTDLERGVDLETNKFWVFPRVAIEHSATYAYVVTDTARDSLSRPLRAQVFAHFMRSAATLVTEDGQSTVDSLSDTEAGLVETHRAQMSGLLDHLETQGVPRSSLAAAVPFTTLSVPEHLLRMRRELYELDTPVTLSNVDNRTPFQRGLLLVMLNVETIVTGTMTTRDYIDPVTTAFRPDGSAIDSPVEFVLTIPEGATVDKPIPVVIFGHGLYTSRELIYLAADMLAQEGYATFAIDLPYHGARSICKHNYECAIGAQCGADHKCWNDDGSPANLLTIENPFPDIPHFDISLLPDIHYPLTSGQYLIDTHDLFATGDHFRQGIVDLMQSVRVLQGADWVTATGGFELSENDLMYLGMSLGGIMGSVLAGVEPEVDNFVLNVPGAGMVTLLENSTFFFFTLQQLLSDKGIEQDSAEYRSFINAAKWALDLADPINFAHHATLDPLEVFDPVTGQTQTSPSKRVLIQMAEGDLVIPNITTEMLAERMGLPISAYTDVGNHALLFDPLPFTGGEGAREEMKEFYDAR